jgi:hypothetical protein
MMETDLNAATDTCTGPEAEEEVQNERCGHVSDDEIQRFIRKDIKWAIETFNKCHATRENAPLLTEMTSESLNYWMQQFVLEVRKQDGSEHPPRSLYYIVCGLLRYLRDQNIHNLNFFYEKIEHTYPRFIKYSTRLL